MASPSGKEVSKAHGVTITNYLLGLFLLASKYATEEVKGDISIQLPVDMRKFYPSNTLANFSMYAGIRFNVNEITILDKILPLIKKQLEEKANYEKMSEMMYSAHKMNHEVRAVPLFLKSPIAKIAYGLIGEAIFTTTFSNIGVVNAPPYFSDYIDSYDFILGPPQVNRAALTLITFKNVSTLTITKSTKDPSFEEELYRLLQKDGLQFELEGSALYEPKRRIPRKKYKKRP